MIDSQYNVVQWIGNKVCTAGTNVASLLVEQPACTSAESWNLGVIVVTAAIALVGIVWIAQRRRERRDGYYWR